MRARAGWSVVLASVLAVAGAACAASGDGGGSPGGPGTSDASTGGGDSSGPSPDAVVVGKDSGASDTGSGNVDSAADDAMSFPDIGPGKSCMGLADGTPCGAAPGECLDPPLCQGGTCAVPQAKPDGTNCGTAPDVCHSAPVCASGACAAPAAKANGTVCAKAPDACHTDGTCNNGSCGSVGTRGNGYNWSPGDATAMCCGGKEVHADTDSNCGVCGIVCNPSNGESCGLVGGHYFCKGCVASAGCWSHCCSESFSPYSCAASDCAGNCDSSYCPAGTHCVSGNGSSSDYCSY
jgi:hypothetical protein